MEIKFVDKLPDITSGPGKLNPIRDALIEQPGRWAEIKRLSGKKTNQLGGTTTLVRRGRRPGFRFEVTTRQEGDDAVLYARAVTSDD